MIFIGIDPGQKGGYAVAYGDAQPIVYPWDGAQFIKDMRELFEDDQAIAALERVAARPGQGVTSMFNFGVSYGYIQGVLSALGIGFQLVPPTTWKRAFGLMHADKQASIDTCKRLVPGINLFPTERCRKESDGMAEATLLAIYAQRNF